MTPMQKVDILRAACCVAGIDGEISDVERTVINKLAAEAGVGRASLEAIKDRALRDPKFHEEQFTILNEDPQISMAAILEVAMSDGQLSEDESEVLRSLSQTLSVPTDVFNQLISNVTKMLD